MNKPILFVLLLWLFTITTASLYGQISLEGRSIKQIKSNQGYELIEFPGHQLKALSQLHLDGSFTIQLDDHWNLDLELLEQEYILSEDLVIRRRMNDSLLLTIEGLEVNVFRGRLKNQSQSQVLLSSIGEEFSLYVKDDKAEYLIEKNVTLDNRENIYKLKKSGAIKLKHDYQCKHRGMLSKVSKSETGRATCKIVDLSIYTDFEFYQQYGNSAAALSRIITAISSSAFDYSTTFDEEIKFQIKEIRLNSCADCQLAPGVTSPGKLLTVFDKHLEENPNDSDISLFMTGKSLDDLYIGVSHLNSICEDNATAIIQNIEDTGWEQRVVLSHEIGHILGCVHDDSRANIMSSSLTNSSTWTTGSISMINNQLSTQSCMIECGSSPECVELSNIQIGEYVNGSIEVSWVYDNGSECFIELVDVQNSETIFSKWSSESNLMIPDLEGCKSYSVSIISYCADGSLNRKYVKTISTDQSADYEITKIELAYCDYGTFGLNITVESQIVTAQEASLLVGGVSIPIQITAQNQQFAVADLTHWLKDDLAISLQILDNGNVICADLKHYDTPDNKCSFRYEENFKKYKMPEFWEYSSSNMGTLEGPFIWKFDDGDREISNYGKYGNVNSSKTIDGSCMAYFDDDVYSNSSYTGMAYLFTPSLDLTNYDYAKLSLDYIFHKFDEKGANSSQFMIEVWDGTNWRILHEASSNNCSWAGIWETDCIESIELDLSPFVNEETRLRFYYTDGNDNKWTGMVAMDNLFVEGYNATSGCMDASALNFNVDATISTPGVCKYPCDEPYKLVSEYPIEQMIIDNADIIEAVGIVNKSVDILAQSKIVLSPSFKVEKGNQVRISHQNCQN